MRKQHNLKGIPEYGHSWVSVAKGHAPLSLCLHGVKIGSIGKGAVRITLGVR